MNEFELIARISPGLPTNPTVVVGVGDDCAVLDHGLADTWLLFKTDAVVEGVHFAPGTAPERVGHKALARCLSDIAAMGGRPSSALVTLALPARFDISYVDGICTGLNLLAQRYRVAIVGGETTSSPHCLLISVAMLGTVPKQRCTLRSGAKPGDALFVTGELGGSLAGKHLDFEPRLAEAEWLTGNFAIHAMIDLSDGLAGDLRHVLKASNVGAELLSDAIPISRAARSQASLDAAPSEPPPAEASADAATELPPARPPRKAPLIAALTDGEDFELLLTAAGRDAVPLLDAWRARFPDLRLTCIGKITSEPGLRVRDRKGLKTLDLHGYAHFE